MAKYTKSKKKKREIKSNRRHPEMSEMETEYRMSRIKLLADRVKNEEPLFSPEERNTYDPFFEREYIHVDDELV